MTDEELALQETIDFEVMDMVNDKTLSVLASCGEKFPEIDKNLLCKYFSLSAEYLSS